LSRADLSYANLSYANLSLFDNARLSIVPEVGSFIGWKKCLNGVIVKIKIQENAKRSNSTGRKCRAEYVKVLEVIGAEKGISAHDYKTTYRIGKTVRCNKWEENRWLECAGGIHFFLTRAEAEAY
jgi:hypothetical protein